jgi:hypothetical protein
MIRYNAVYQESLAVQQMHWPDHSLSSSSNSSLVEFVPPMFLVQLSTNFFRKANRKDILEGYKKQDSSKAAPFPGASQGLFLDDQGDPPVGAAAGAEAGAVHAGRPGLEEQVPAGEAGGGPGGGRAGGEPGGVPAAGQGGGGGRGRRVHGVSQQPRQLRQLPLLPRRHLRGLQQEGSGEESAFLYHMQAGRFGSPRRSRPSSRLMPSRRWTGSSWCSATGNSTRAC